MQDLGEQSNFMQQVRNTRQRLVDRYGDQSVQVTVFDVQVRSHDRRTLTSIMAVINMRLDREVRL